jgi:hypothetical protein
LKRREQADYLRLTFLAAQGGNKDVNRQADKLKPQKALGPEDLLRALGKG